ncbi:MAG: cyclic nucleotide-binding domain-containing protein [Vicinamibacteria bacterium]
MTSIQDLLAQKSYAKAIELVKLELRKRPKDVRLRLQHADALIGANRNREAIPLLMGLADEHASDGFTAKAIAFLKRIDKLEPGRQDVQDRLDHLVQEKVSRATSAPTPRPAMEFGFEEIDSSSSEITLGTSEEPLAVPEIEESALDLEGMDSIEIDEPAEPEPTSVSQQARSFLQTPLFEGFEQSELAAIIRGLKFLSFEPGDVLVGEGAPGNSMFIIASGRAKVWVRNPKGEYLMVKVLGEGDFFGEVSLISGKPRTATIVAAVETEVLELDKPTLDQIAQSHPHVKQVLSTYQKKRAQETVEAIFKSKD